jgi:hypothetical protein
MDCIVRHLPNLLQQLDDRFEITEQTLPAVISDDRLGSIVLKKSEVAAACCR